jgi:hypothetical protein
MQGIDGSSFVELELFANQIRHGEHSLKDKDLVMQPCCFAQQHKLLSLLPELLRRVARQVSWRARPAFFARHGWARSPLSEVRVAATKRGPWPDFILSI